jgi:hypothetical protein
MNKPGGRRHGKATKSPIDVTRNLMEASDVAGLARSLTDRSGDKVGLRMAHPLIWPAWIAMQCQRTLKHSPTHDTPDCLEEVGTAASPFPGFSASYYVSRNPDVAASGIDPFLHWVRFGSFEGRSISPTLAPPSFREALDSDRETRARVLLAVAETPLRTILRAGLPRCSGFWEQMAEESSPLIANG